ncbi:hypothetical protein [Tengunoibacter tsumagoiensis]|uniref:hypothetical protein n=1 Tax=Tengunoibacter tsumagoiensis TaxID=2014871 RepID=UPI000F82197F|nr:hypothetical protein [Tengunoibacter tsumagoiensis]
MDQTRDNLDQEVAKSALYIPRLPCVHFLSTSHRGETKILAIRLGVHPTTVLTETRIQKLLARSKEGR